MTRRERDSNLVFFVGSRNRIIHSRVCRISRCLRASRRVAMRRWLDRRMRRHRRSRRLKGDSRAERKCIQKFAVRSSPLRVAQTCHLPNVRFDDRCVFPGTDFVCCLPIRITCFSMPCRYFPRTLLSTAVSWASNMSCVGGDWPRTPCSPARRSRFKLAKPARSRRLWENPITRHF